MELILSKKVEQEIRTGLITGKKFKTVDESVVGKWVSIVKVDGFIGSAVGESKELSIEKAVEKAKELAT